MMYYFKIHTNQQLKFNKTNKITDEFLDYILIHLMDNKNTRSVM